MAKNKVLKLTATLTDARGRLFLIRHLSSPITVDFVDMRSNFCSVTDGNRFMGMNSCSIYYCNQRRLFNHQLKQQKLTNLATDLVYCEGSSHMLPVVTSLLFRGTGQDCGQEYWALSDLPCVPKEPILGPGLLNTCGCVKGVWCLAQRLHDSLFGNKLSIFSSAAVTSHFFPAQLPVVNGKT